MGRLLGYFGVSNAEDILVSMLKRPDADDPVAGESDYIFDLATDKTGSEDADAGMTSFVMDNHGTLDYHVAGPAATLPHCRSKWQFAAPDQRIMPPDTDNYPDTSPLRCEEGFSTAIASSRPCKQILVIRRGGPAMIIGFRNDGFLIASDLADIIYCTRHYRVIEDNEMAILSSQGACFVTLDGRPLRSVLYAMQDTRLYARILGIGLTATLKPATGGADGTRRPGPV